MNLKHHSWVQRWLAAGLAALLIVGCRGSATPSPTPVSAGPAFVQANAGRTNVTLLSGGTSRPLLPPEAAQLRQGDGIDVDAGGQAILRFSDFLTVEVLRNGELVVQELDISDQSALAVFGQSAGAFVNDMAPGAGEVERRVTIETEFAVITATGTRFMIAKEANSPLEWIFGLDAGPDDLYIQAKNDPNPANPVRKPVESGMARWVAPMGEPSAGIAYDVQGVNAWLRSMKSGAEVGEVGTVLWPQADMRMDLATIPADDVAGKTVDMQGVAASMAANTDFGTPAYAWTDCNADGIQDLLVENGVIDWDFRGLPARVSGLDVTLIAFNGAAQGMVQTFDPANQLVARRSFDLSQGQGEVIAMRAEEPYHYARLTLNRGCFLGISLTAPLPDGKAGLPQPAVEAWPPRTAPAVRPTATPTPAPIPTPTPAPQAYVRMDQPQDGSTTANGFILAGESSYPFEGTLNILIETLDGQPIQTDFVMVDSRDGQPYSDDPAFFQKQIFVDADLPQNVRVRVQQISARDGSVEAEDSVLLRPLNLDNGKIRRPEGNGVIQAWPVNGDGYSGLPVGMKMDGSPEEWETLQQEFNLAPVDLAATVYDNGCAVRAPATTTRLSVDFAAQALFAYDAEALYAAFFVRDETYAPYSGRDERFFLGDSPQILLDLDLGGDFSDRANSADDVQIDLHPGTFGDGGIGEPPRAALWQLSTLTAQPLDAAVASAQSALGYFVEAAIPWRSLGLVAPPPWVLGIAASVSDNDTPGTNKQECMISSAPDRDFRDPTTWGTMDLLIFR